MTLSRLPLHRRLSTLLACAAGTALLAAVLSTPGAGAADQSWSTTADVIADVTNPDPGVRHTGTIRALVWDLEEHEGVMYAAGKFLDVRTTDGATHRQSYLAAFDLDTGAWIDTFRPSVDGAVYAIDITEDGRLLAGGELTGGVAAFDLATGARDAAFSPGIVNRWGPPAVFDVEAHGARVFVGGTFTGAPGLELANLAKLDVTTGVVDPTWRPTADLDTGTPRLAGSLVWGIAVDDSRNRVYLAGKFGGINGDTSAPYFATLDPESGQLRPDVPQGIPRNILNHREAFSMWMHDVQFRDDKVYLGGQGHQTIVMDAATLTPESSHFTNRGVGDRWTGGDTQVIFVGETVVWSGCHCWGSVGPYPLGSYIADPAGLQTYAEYAQWVADFRTVNQFGQQRVRGGFGIDIASQQLVPLTFDLGGQAGAYAIAEDSSGRLWLGGQFTRDPVTNRVIEGIARFSPVGDLRAGPSGLRSTLQTRERAVLTWARVNSATSYSILRDGVEVGTTSGVWFTDLGLTAGRTYRYEVRAIFADGAASEPSTAVEVRTVEPDEPIPTGLRSTRQTRERVVLTWDRTDGAASYEIERDGAVVGSTTGVWFTNTGLAAGTEYVFTVHGVRADGSLMPRSPGLSVATLP